MTNISRWYFVYVYLCWILAQYQIIFPLVRPLKYIAKTPSREFLFSVFSIHFTFQIMKCTLVTNRPPPHFFSQIARRHSINICYLVFRMKNELKMCFLGIFSLFLSVCFFVCLWNTRFLILVNWNQVNYWVRIGAHTDILKRGWGAIFWNNINICVCALVFSETPVLLKCFFSK